MPKAPLPQATVIRQGGGLALKAAGALGLVAAGGWLVYHFTHKKGGTNPADIHLDAVTIESAEGALVWREGLSAVKVPPYAVLQAVVDWTNTGGGSISPTLNFALRRTGGTATWQEGPSATAPRTGKGQRATTTVASIPVPRWPEGTTIDIRLVMVGQEGAWWERDDVLVLESRPESLVEVMGVTLFRKPSYAP